MLKRILVAIGLGVLPAAAAFASPYFLLLDPAHPQPVVGALIDVRALGNTSTAALLPLITHSPKDGCLLPTLSCEDWAPIAVGAAMIAGHITFDAGPLANVLPSIIGGVLYLAPAAWQTAWKTAESSANAGVAVSFGPVWEYSQLTNKGSFKLFSGLALHF